MSENDELLRKYLDGDLSAEEEREALHLFAEDKEMRSFLRFELSVKKTFSSEMNLSSFEVPEGFSENVMDQIYSLQTHTSHNYTEQRKIGLQKWLSWLWQPRSLHLRPAYMMILLLVIAVLITLPNYLGPQGQVQNAPVTQSVQKVSESSGQVLIRFVYIDEDASSVAVAGDFSNWDPISLSSQIVNGEKIWTGLVSANRGEHHYMFVKDGKQWVTDPLASMHREDGFGNQNAVIYL